MITSASPADPTSSEAINPTSMRQPRDSLVFESFTWLTASIRLIAFAAITGITVGIALAFLSPVTYTSSTSMLAPNSAAHSGAAAALNALGGAAAGIGGFAQRTPDELYVAILRSDRVLRALDGEFGLKARWDEPHFAGLRRAADKRIRTAIDRRSGMITLSVVDRDAAFAARLANAHADRANEVLATLAVTEAQRRRVFFSTEVERVQAAVTKAEENLRQIQERSRLIVPDKQSELLFQRLAQVRSRLAEREVQLQVLRGSATDANPSIRLLQSEIAALAAEIARLERDGGAPRAAGASGDLNTSQLPALAIELLRARRELKTQELMFESLLRQLEAARLDEAREGSQLQIVESAVPADRRSGPQRLLLVMASLTAFVLGAALIALVRGWWRTRRQGLRPESNAPRLDNRWV